MALILKKLYLGYHYINNELSDKRVNDYYFVSPVHVILFTIGYLYFVNKLGPNIMRNRKPLYLRPVLIGYNVLQVLCNALLLYYVIPAISKINWECATVDYSQKKEAMFHLQLVYCYYLLKIFDTLDTVFFVLRKSNRQISFLHVYHHAGMTIGAFLVVKFFGGGELLWTGLFNVTVHCIMFTYYLLTVIDKEWKKSIKFKKIITQFQIAQFVLNILLYGRLFFKQDCSFPKFVSYIYVPQNIFMLLLFSDFYIKEYLKEYKKKV